MSPSNKPLLIGGLCLLLLFLYVTIPIQKERFADRQSLQKIIEDLEYRRWQKQSSKKQFQLEASLLADQTSAFNYEPRAKGLRGRNPFMEMQRQYKSGGNAAQRRLEASLARDPAQYRAWSTFNRNYNPTFNKDMQMTNADRELDKIIHSRSGSSGTYNRAASPTWNRGNAQWANTVAQRRNVDQQGTPGSRRFSGRWNQRTGGNTGPRLSRSQQGASGASNTNPTNRSWSATYSYRVGDGQYSKRMTQGDRILDSVIHSSRQSN